MRTDDRHPPKGTLVGELARRSHAATLLLPKFIDHRERDAHLVRAALEKADFEVIRRIGHNMRGNSQSYGFPELGAMGERFEAAADGHDPARVREQLNLLDAWLREQRASPRPA